MNILIIDEEFPYPLNTGKRIRSFNLAHALSRENRVSYLAYGEQGSDGCAHLESAGITPIAVGELGRKKSGPRFYLRLLANLFSPYPYIVAHHYTRRFAREVARRSSTGDFDIVICEWSPYARFVKSLTEVPSVVVAHNIEASIWRRYLENETNPLKRAYIALQFRKVERFERSCFLWAAGATAVSRDEADTIARFGVPYPVAVIDNGVDTEYFRPGGVSPDPDTLVFTGSMDWRPNQDAVAYFADDVFPRIRAERPGANVYVVGRNPPIQIRELGLRDGITVTGTVDDVRPYIERAGVYIVPLRIGGGSRLKILEAMAMSKVVVSTSVGAEGLEVIDGEHLLIRDGSEALARQILECMANLPTYESLGRRGRRLVEQRYRWEELGRRYNEYLQTILKRA